MSWVLIRWNPKTPHIILNWTYFVFPIAILVTLSLICLTAPWSALFPNRSHDWRKCEVYAGARTTSQLCFWHNWSHSYPILSPSALSRHFFSAILRLLVCFRIDCGILASSNTNLRLTDFLGYKLEVTEWWHQEFLDDEDDYIMQFRRFIGFPGTRMYSFCISEHI